MQRGEVIADRFELERLAGEGGMGAVWAARDRTTGRRVALKVQRGIETERLLREARVLAETVHPNVVSLVAYGADALGGVWIAMEWIEGEDLATRIGRGPLTVAETIELGRRIAGALAALHARGVIHRDVKPTNVMLRGGRVGDPALLDLGLARVQDAARTTRVGVTLGTPGYMSPEQARGAADLDARADVYSLGCVIFECIAGAPVFDGDHPVAILAKVLMQDAPRLSEVVTGIPADVDALVSRMLSKDPAARPKDGAAVEAELATIAKVASASSDVLPKRAVSAPAPSLSESEAYVATVVLASSGATLAADAPQRISDLAMTVGATIDVLPDGSLFGLFARRGAARDQAVAAARLALAFAAMMPGSACALATGRTALASRTIVGEAIDRASALLRAPKAPGVRIDDVTAGLLDARFEVQDHVLRHERDKETVRSVLGRHVPCVGRGLELSTLETIYDDAVRGSAARAVVLTGAAGAGKSRVLHELVQRLRTRVPEPSIWIGRGDPMRAGSPLAILADALRRVMGIHASEPLDVRRWRIQSRAGEPRVAWFLGEMLGAPFDASDNEQIASARRDARLMADQMRQAFEDFVSAELALRPVVLVLEDLHWGDAAVVSFVDSLLRVSAHKPLVVAATGRDEVRARFPRMWEERAPIALHLEELDVQAAAQLVRAILPTLRAERIATLVERGAGNALFLEELVRAEAEGRGASTPGSVLAMVTSRLDNLAPDLRRVLRAASVLGRSTWRGALESLLQLPSDVVSAALAQLVEQEILVRMAESRFANDDEYLFRHEIVREAAYGMLTDADRALAHARAGKWLERAGEHDELVLAEHFDKGGDAKRAIAHYLRATEQALDSSDFDAAFAHAERGIELGATWETCGELRSRQVESMMTRADYGRAIELGELALADLALHGPAWCETASHVATAARRKGDSPRAEALAAEMLKAPATVCAPFLRLAYLFAQYERDDLAEAFADKGKAAKTPAERFFLHAYGLQRNKAAGDIGAGIVQGKLAVKAAEEANNLRYVCSAKANLGDSLKEVGAYAEASAVLADAVRIAERIGEQQLRAVALQNLGLVRGRDGALAEGLGYERDAAAAFEQNGDKRMAGGSELYIATMLLEAGQIDAAEPRARAALAAFSGVKGLEFFANATLARILAARGDARGAAQTLRDALAYLDSGGRMEEGEGTARLARAETLHAMGDARTAREAIVAARRALLERASRIGDADYRRSFLERVPEHALTMTLYDRWTRTEA